MPFALPSSFFLCGSFFAFAPAAPCDGAPLLVPCAAVISTASSGSTSARSTLSPASASIRSSRGTARSTILSSLAGEPHQRGLRTRVTSSSLRSTFFSANGPAVTFSLLRALSLKLSGVPMTSFGYSGVNSDFQSA